MTFLTDAHSRLIANLATCRPSEISVNPDADDFEARAEHVRAVAAMFDEYLHALACDAATNGHAMKSEHYTTLVADAVHDSGLTGDLADEAERVREWQAEFNADRSGWAKARYANVD